jgi:uncharacterized protein (DUF924 family)
MDPTIDELIEFWFERTPTNQTEVDDRMRRWYGGGSDIDAGVEKRFAAAMTRAAAGELDRWAGTARGCLALILLLDQCPRNAFRGQSEAFAQDEKALKWTLDGMTRGLDLELDPLQRIFFYMPMQHSESLEIQERSVAVFEDLARNEKPEFLQTCLSASAEYARLHRDIIARFGRFPHRNVALGRDTTPEEREYLAKGAPSFGQ